MIEIKKITVENFYSIDRAELEFSNGIFLVYGNNKDASKGTDDVVSNGSGKTTLFNALFQGLYNKNLKDVKGTVNSVNNIYTKKPYRIVIEFNVGDDSYIVDNDRNTNKISVIKNGEDISVKGIANSLVLIKNIIGLDFDSFSSLVFLNSTSLDNIIDISSKENLVYQFFNIDKLKEFEKNVKNRKKAIKDEMAYLIVKKNSILTSLSALENVPEYDEEELLENKSVLQEALIELGNSKEARGIATLEKRLQAYSKELTEVNTEYTALASKEKTYKQLLSKFDEGVCPVCGSTVSEKVTSFSENLEEVSKEIEEVLKAKKEIQSKIDELAYTRSIAVKKYEDKKRNIVSQINSVNAKLEAVRESKEKLTKIAESKDLMTRELEEIDKIVNDLSKREEFLNIVLSILKRGEIIEEYLKTYRKLLHKNIQTYSTLSSFTISIKTYVEKGKLKFIFEDENEEKTFYQLSSGERTRVSLIILLSTLKTIEQLSGVSINVLVLDELLSSLDEEGISFLKTLLSKLSETKSVFIITHHDEIEKEYADKALYIVKENNLTTIERIEDVK